ncbi:retinol dehydrogenase 14-like, partial [Limulus polyphemus]|uniref:Retinol dehydrogenase 14-like n=1 Tax=Limulus polyphemus TaxID=6850 RepID=A0ABM1C4E0_LIMPO
RGHKIVVEGLEEQFASNHFGHFLLTNLLLDMLKKSTPSRIVVVSSTAYKWGKIEFDNLNMEKRVDEPFTVYCNTKLSNVLFTKELSRRLQGTGVTANCVHPGAVKTEIGRQMNPLLSLLTIPLFKYFLKSSLEGAQTSIHVAVAEHLTTVSGKYFVDCQEIPLDPIAEDEGLAKKLWEVSEKLTKL